MTKCNTYFLCVSLLLTDVFCLFFSTQNGPDGDVKDDLDSGDEADGKKIDTEEVLKTNALLTTNTTTMAHTFFYRIITPILGHLLPTWDPST